MSHQRCDQKTGSVWSSFSLLCVQEPHVTTQRKSSRAGRQKHRELLKYGSPPGCSGFFLAGHDLFRSVGLCRGERRWYLSALLFTALFCNATGWTCLKPWQAILLWEAGWLSKVNCFILSVSRRHPGAALLWIGPLKAAGSYVDDPTKDYYEDVYESFQSDVLHSILEGNEEK